MWRLYLFLSAAVLLTAQETQWARLLPVPVFDVAVNPLNPRTLYAGGLGRMLYRSYDGGITWDTLVIDFPGGAAQFLDIFLHPRDTATLLVGGSGFGKLVRSSDGGASWEDVLVPEHAFLLPSGASIVAHPQHPDTIVLTEFIGPGWTAPRLYRSTDGGRHWDTLTPAAPEAIPNCAMAVRADSALLILARCDGALFASADWGTSWYPLARLRLPGFPQESEIPDLTFVADSAQLGFLAVTFLFDTAVGGIPNGGLYRTTDGGRSWELLAFRDTSLWAVAARRLQGRLELFVGGFTLYEDTLGRPLVPGSGIVRRSPDGGRTWEVHDGAIPWASERVVLRRVWRMVYGPTGTLYLATEAGLFQFPSSSGVALPPSDAGSTAAVLLSTPQWRLWATASGELVLYTPIGQRVAAWRVFPGWNELSLERLPSGLWVAQLHSTAGVVQRWLVLVP